MLKEKMDFKVVCTNENYFFRLGISKIIEEALLSDSSVEFLRTDSSQSLGLADFILINAAQWRLYMCQPAYRARKPGSIIIVFTDNVEDITLEQLPVCYHSIIIISRNDSIRDIHEKIIRFWVGHQGNRQGFLPSYCAGCVFARVTIVQLQVLSFLKKGYNVGQIAKHLNLSVKTVYTHKYNVMKKFSLNGDRQFNAFINDLSLFELYKGIIDNPEP